MDIKPGGIRMSLEAVQERIFHPVTGLLGTSGVRYSSVVTFGTTPAEIWNQLIDPSANLSLDENEVGLTQRFDNLLATSVGSLIYHWDVREEWYDRSGVVGTKRTGAWIGITGTYVKGIPTSGVAGDPAEDTFSGYIPVGSIPHAPVRLRLTAVGLVANSMTGEVKNSSYIRLAGVVIPGV